jgi:hypothetical protein
MAQQWQCTRVILVRRCHTTAAAAAFMQYQFHAKAAAAFVQVQRYGLKQCYKAVLYSYCMWMLLGPSNRMSNHDTPTLVTVCACLLEYN